MYFSITWNPKARYEYHDKLELTKQHCINTWKQSFFSGMVIWQTPFKVQTSFRYVLKNVVCLIYVFLPIILRNERSQERSRSSKTGSHRRHRNNSNSRIMATYTVMAHLTLVTKITRWHVKGMVWNRETLMKRTGDTAILRTQSTVIILVVLLCHRGVKDNCATG